MTVAVCDFDAYEPYSRLLMGWLHSMEDLNAIERYMRTFVLHDEMILDPTLNLVGPHSDFMESDYYYWLRPVGNDGQEFWHQVYPPDASIELSASLVDRASKEVGGEPNRLKVLLRFLRHTFAVVKEGGSVLLGNEFGSSLLQIAGAYPVELFQQLDEDWRKYVTQLHRDGLDFVVPPVLAIVLSRCASRDAVPSVLRDLREEWSDARQKVWHSLDRLRTARTLGEAIEIRRELSEASKSFAPEPTEHDSRPMRVFWEIITAAGMGAGILALSGGKPAIGAITGAMTQVPRSVPALLHDFGPAVFGRGAFDLARRVRRALSQVELDALTRLLSKTEKRRLGFG